MLVGDALVPHPTAPAHGWTPEIAQNGSYSPLVWALNSQPIQTRDNTITIIIDHLLL